MPTESDQLEQSAVEPAPKQSDPPENPENAEDSAAEPVVPDQAESLPDQEPPAAEVGATQNADQPKEAATVSDLDRLKRILSLSVPVIAKVAEKNMSLADVLKLTIGSVIQFDKDAYDHIELMANNCTIGLGQPVKIGENFGLRIMEVGKIDDMIRKLGGDDSQGSSQ